MATHWKYEGDYFVDAVNGNDANAGTSTAPTKTIPAAVALAEAAAGGYYTIVVGPGVYTDRIVAGSTSHYITLQADGQVIFDASDTGDSAFYDGYLWRVKDFIIINAETALLKAASGTRMPKFTRCYIKNCDWVNTFTYANLGYYFYRQCIFENVITTQTIAGGAYFRYWSYDSCLFINSTPAGFFVNGARSSGNNYTANTNNCVLFTTPGSGIVSWQRYNTSNDFLQNSVVANLTKIQDQNIGTRSGSAMVEDIFNQQSYRYYYNNVNISMSFNDNLSGSAYLTDARWTLPGTTENKDFFQQAIFDSSLLGGTRGLATAYGSDYASSNPLTPAGGATWTNITSSIAGGFQISGSTSPTGTIESAVIDQGSVKTIKEIKTSWASSVPAATGFAVYTSSALNQYPTRQTFEMRYGNQSDLSSAEYKIFEIGAPTFVDANGSGSGDQYFTTGSDRYVDARYIQLKYTLRTNLTGSI